MLHETPYATKKYDASGCRLTQSVMRHVLSNRRREWEDA
jgi:hypothetical protein